MFKLNKTILSMILSLSLVASAFAGSEDWSGTFTIQAHNGSVQSIEHSPNGVSFLFFRVGSCLFLSKGSRVNGLVMKEDINLCRDMDVEQFTVEVQKLGSILSKTITLGPTY